MSTEGKFVHLVQCRPLGWVHLHHMSRYVLADALSVYIVNSLHVLSTRQICPPNARYMFFMQERHEVVVHYTDLLYNEREKKKTACTEFYSRG